MAEIRVEPKRGARNLTWLWLLIILAILAVAGWWLYTHQGSLRTGALGAPAASVVAMAGASPIVPLVLT